jgi:putative ABC transport system substrate-binding protein
MIRREFITLLGGVAAAWPRVAHGQQATRPVIGLLMMGAPERTAHFVAAFRRGLADTGYVEGQNAAIEYRFAEGRPERLPELAADLVRRRVAVIAAAPRAELAIKAATASIPLVFITGGDPVRSGLVASMNQPGGNLTGVTILTNDLEAKRIGLLREIVPQAESMAVLLDSSHSERALLTERMQAAGRNVGVRINVISASHQDDFDTTFATILRARVDALIVASSVLFFNLRNRFVVLAAHHKIPAMYEAREYVEAGGLMSYSASSTEGWRQVGIYTGRILNGARPSDLPVMQPTKFELVVNLKTAKALDFTFPSAVLAIADEVIE